MDHALGLLIESYRLHIWAFGIGPTLTSIINEHLSYLCLSTWWHMQCIVSAFRAGYEHGMYHPGTCCQVSYIPSSGWGGSCLPSLGNISNPDNLSSEEILSKSKFLSNQDPQNSPTVFCVQTSGGSTKHA